MDNNEEKFKKALEHIGNIAKELNKLPKLSFPELTSDMNDMLWCYDSIQECDERMIKENDIASITFYEKEKAKRHLKIQNTWLHFLN